MAANLEVTINVDSSGAIQGLTAAGEKFEVTSEQIVDTEKSLDRFEQVLEEVVNQGKLVDAALQDAFSDVDDVTGKIDALDRTAIDFGLTMEQVASNVDLGAENFGEEIRGFRDELEELENPAEEVSNKFQEIREEAENAGNEVQETSQNIESISDSSEDASESIDDASDSAGAFADNMETISASGQQADSAIEGLSETVEQTEAGFTGASNSVNNFTNDAQNLENRTEQTNEAIKEQVQALELSEQQIRNNKVVSQQLARTQGQLNSSFRRTGVRTGNLNEILFSAGDAVQDFQFGLRGAGNNLAFMAENLVQAQQKAGGFVSVLKAVFSSLKGPIGIIVGLQTLLALGPKLSEWFSSRTEEAGEMEKALKGAAEQLLDFSDSIEGFTFDSIQEAEKAQQLAQRKVEARRNEVDVLDKVIARQETNSGLGRNYLQILGEQERQVFERLNLGEKTTEEIKEQRSRLQGQLDEWSKILDRSTSLLTDRRGLLKVEREIRKELSFIDREQENVNASLRTAQSILSNISQEELTIGDLDVTDILTPQDIKIQLQEGTLSTLKSVETAINVVRDAQRTAEGERIKELDNLIQRLEERREALKGVGDEAENTFQSLQQLQVDNLKEVVPNLKQVGEAISFVKEEFEKTDQTSEDQINTLDNLLSRLEEIEEQYKRSGDEGQSAFESISEIQPDQIENLKGISDALSLVKEQRSDASGERLKQLNRIKVSLNNRKKELKELGTEGKLAFESISEVQPRLLNDLNEVEAAISFVQEELGKLDFDAPAEDRTQLENLLQRLKDLKAQYDSSTDAGVEGFSSVEDVLSGLNGVSDNTINSIERAEQAMSFLDQKIREATSDEQRERFRRIRDRVQELLNTFKKGQNEVDSFGSALENLDKQRILANALTKNFEQLGKAIGQGENVMKSFGKAALGVLADVGTAMGKQLVAKGSALVASALLGNPANAAAGAKLIAVGTGLIAASQALSSKIGGDGGSGSSGNNSESLEGGGESGFAPGRREGGPVERGMIYRTHGLGEREFFMPNQDGQIATQDQLKSATQRRRTRAQEVRVRTENRIEGSIDGPDLFELDTRLKEVEQFKKEYAEQ